MTNASKTPVALLLALAVSSTVTAQDEEVLDEVLVTGGRDAVRTLAGSATYIDEEEIAEFDATDISELLLRSPGIYIRAEDGYGLRPNVGIRGAAAERSQKITLMEDGILIAPAPYSAPAAYYFPNVNRMRAVEVIKGPASIHYGPHTVGGAVNLVTRPVPSQAAGMVEASFGSDNYRKYRASYGNRLGNIGFLVDALRYGADGFKALDGGGDTGFTRNDLNLKLEWQAGADAVLNQRLQLKLGYAEEISDETYLGLSDVDFAIDPDRRYVASSLDRFESEHTQVHALHMLSFDSSLQLSTKAYVNHFERAWNKFDGLIGGPSPNLVLARPDIFAAELDLIRGDIDSADLGGMLVDVTNNDREYGAHGLEVSAIYILELGRVSHELEAGLRWHHDYVDRDHRQRGYAVIDGALQFDGNDARPRKALNEGRTDAAALYLSDAIQLERWSFDIGVRVENIAREFDDGLDDTFTTNDETVVLPGLGVHWQWRDDLGLFAGINRGFSPAAPAAGSEVNSEESTNFEYGLRFDRDALHAELIGFFSDYSNLIGRCRVSDSVCDPGQEFSAGKVEIAGVEASGNYSHDFANGWSLPVSLVYTYTESAFQQSFLSDFPQWGNVQLGDELPYLPEHSARLQLGLQSDEYVFALAYRYVSAMREQAGSGELRPGEHTAAYGILNLSAGWGLSEAWKLLAVVENVMDERDIVSRRPIGARPTAPRMLRLTATYRF